MEEEEHHWKFSPGDLKEREHWDDYMRYYEEAINKTSKPHAPWFIIPADDKEMARYMVGKIIWEEMQLYKDVKEPQLDEKIAINFEEYKKQLEG